MKRIKRDRRPSLNLLLDSGDAITRVRVIAEEVRSARASPLLQLLKKLRELDRWIAEFVNDDGSDTVRLSFVTPRIFQGEYPRSDPYT